MSIEEVIDFLKSKKKLYSQMDESDRKDYVMECLDTAINLLSNKADGDLISRQAVIDTIRSMDRNDHIDEYTENVIEYFEKLPSTEKTAEMKEQKEIIRCKECKYNHGLMNEEYNPNDIVCDYWESDGLTENDFCSFAEQR